MIHAGQSQNGNHMLIKFQKRKKNPWKHEQNVLKLMPKTAPAYKTKPHIFKMLNKSPNPEVDN